MGKDCVNRKKIEAHLEAKRILLEKLNEKLYEAERRETELIARRGWGYGMRHSKIGFSTRVSDNLKARIERCSSEIEVLVHKLVNEVLSGSEEN